MTIRLEKTNGTTYANSRGVRLVIQSTVAVDTEAEALEAKRAFENVLAPRFTRDEAIAIVKAHRGVNAVLTVEPMTNARREYIAGMRAALEAIAAAGVFVDGRNMADRLDAAGIR